MIGVIIEVVIVGDANRSNRSRSNNRSSSGGGARISNRSISSSMSNNSSNSSMSCKRMASKCTKICCYMLYHLNTVLHRYQLQDEAFLQSRASFSTTFIYKFKQCVSVCLYNAVVLFSQPTNLGK